MGTRRRARRKCSSACAIPARAGACATEILNGLPGWYNHYLATGGGWGGMQLVSLRNERNTPFQGKRMAELIAGRGGDPVDVLFDVLLEEDGSVPTVFFHHSEADMQLVMKQPWTSIGSDGIRGQRRRLDRQQGIRTRGITARFRACWALRARAARADVGRGRQEDDQHERRQDRHQGPRTAPEGMWADVTIFDANRVIDRATFDNPHQYPVGIQDVIVNGVVTVEADRQPARWRGT